MESFSNGKSVAESITQSPYDSVATFGIEAAIVLCPHRHWVINNIIIC